MKHTSSHAILSRSQALLVFVRDNNPTELQFIESFGGPGGQVFHVLRKEGAIVVEDGRVRLSRRHLSPDGSYFFWGTSQIFLDRDEVRSLNVKGGGPLVFDTDA